jgi:hypothetical protein
MPTPQIVAGRADEVIARFDPRVDSGFPVHPLGRLLRGSLDSSMSPVRAISTLFPRASSAGEARRGKFIPQLGSFGNYRGITIPIDRVRQWNPNRVGYQDQR